MSIKTYASYSELTVRLTVAKRKKKQKKTTKMWSCDELRLVAKNK